MNRKTIILFSASLALVAGRLSQAAVVFTSAGPITANETGSGSNLSGMTVTRSSTASDVLYFKYTVTNPASNSTNENYYAGLQLWEGGNERLGVGNAWGPYAYSAFATAGSDVDLHSAMSETGQVWQLVRASDTTTLVFKVEYVNGGNDNISVWLNPDLGLSEAAQNSALLTTFQANATFDEVRLREGGGGSGWTFSNIAIATSGTDTGFFIPEASSALLGGLGVLVLTRRRRA